MAKVIFFFLFFATLIACFFIFMKHSTKEEKIKFFKTLGFVLCVSFLTSVFLFLTTI